MQIKNKVDMMTKCKRYPIYTYLSISPLLYDSAPDPTSGVSMGLCFPNSRFLFFIVFFMRFMTSLFFTFILNNFTHCRANQKYRLEDASTSFVINVLQTFKKYAKIQEYRLVQQKTVLNYFSCRFHILPGTILRKARYAY